MDYILYALIIVLIILSIINIIISIRNKPKSSDTKYIESQINRLNDQMQSLTSNNYEQQIKMMETLNINAERQTRAVANAIQTMQASNERKLDEMRMTVDEKLNDTLEKRLNTSFQAVSNQLSAVYKSLGEMKELSSGVTDSVTGLNRVLTNVKARGTWAEVQLGNILDQTIPNMYETNVRSNPRYNGQVEFAVKIPNAENDSIVWLPIDSKFPMEDYARLSAASEAGDAEMVEKARKALEQRVREEGRAIKNYVAPPYTTPFAILYLATEGLYAEVMSSKSGIAEKLQSDGIMIAGPSTITALLNSLSIGFRSIAINQRANDVWKVLGSAKVQYDKFADLLKKAKSKVDDASKILDDAESRNDLIKKNLKSVESLEA